ncbi:MAG: glycosyltransferase family 4 protein [Actinobacteria bacterium]|nr:glycosyltransferase family 4 protein [Actinomycetota bacterium]
MRIAMVGLRGLPATFGGIEKHVEELGSRLVAAGHEVTVYCRPSYAADPATIRPEYGYVPPVGRTPGRYRGMILRNLPAPDGKGLEAFVHSGLAAGASVGRGYDIVHFHALGPGLFTPIPKYLTRAGVVQTIHGLDDERSKWGKAAKLLLGTGRRFSARVPDEVVVVSKDLQRTYREVHGRESTYIPNGGPQVRHIPPGATLAKHGLEAGRYAMFLGRLVPEKDPGLVIEAFRAVETDVRLAIVGDSANTDDFTAGLKAAAARDPRVVMTGYVYGDALAEIMTSAALFLQPSKLEGLPITLLEAAAYEMACVVSDIPPHLEVVGESGPGHRVFPVTDAAAFADAIQAELADRQASTAGAREWSREVAAHYDWDQATAQLIEVYRRAARRRS